MSRPVLTIAGWVAATAAAVAIAHAGVSAVAGRVVEPLPPAVGLGGPSTDGTDGTDVTTSSPSPSAARSSPDPGPGDDTDRTPPEPTTAPGSPDLPRSVAPSPQATAGPTPSPTPAASSTPPPASAAEVRSYALVGGTVTLRYDSGRVTVVAAEPAQGFSMEVEGDGTDRVVVEFESDGHRSRLRGEWDEDGPEDRVEEDDRSDDD